MAQATYGQIGGLGGYLARRAPFTGNSMTAQYAEDGTYTVWSYGTVIATVKAGEVWVNDEVFSKTTSRQQNLCRAWL